MRPGGYHMGKITAPDDVVHADLVAQLDADRIVIKSPVAPLLDVLARPPIESGNPEVALGPESVLLVFGVQLLQVEGQPSHVVLGPVNAQAGEPVEDTGKDELADGQPATTRGIGVTIESLDEIVRRAVEGWLLRILQELSAASTGDRRVNGHRHP